MLYQKYSKLKLVAWTYRVKQVRIFGWEILQLDDCFNNCYMVIQLFLYEIEIN